MKIASLTDIGGRENNEDRLVVESFGNIHLLAVADGLGGHSAGEVASGLAVIELKESIKKALSEGITDFGIILWQACEKANRDIFDIAKDIPEYSNMGTTMVAALIEGERCVIANIGDSRAYLIGSEIRQITKDHSLVQELVDRGAIAAEEAFDHPQKNVVTRTLGAESEVSPDFYEEELSGRLLLLCSDGLSDLLRDQDIWETVVALPSLDEACTRLIDLANEKGGRDNITVVLARGEPSKQ